MRKFVKTPNGRLLPVLAWREMHNGKMSVVAFDANLTGEPSTIRNLCMEIEPEQIVYVERSPQ